MTKSQYIISLLLFISLTLFGQKKKSPQFDIVDFNEKAKTSEWLYLYDAIAWWTSDSVSKQDTNEIKKLGQEWFCFQSKDNNWHAIYGKYHKGDFDLVFHFLVDTNYTVSRIYEPVDTLKLNSYSRALILANNQIQAIKDSINLRFNQYILQNPDSTFTVWIFPAFQPNNLAVYGGEFIYTIDKIGKNILSDKSYFQGQFRAFEVGEPREVWLNFTELEKPTLGTVFFVWYYKKYFTKINIDNQYYVTTAISNGDGNYSWLHVMQEQKRKKKKK